MKIFIVLGNTGVYSERQQWIVCAYLCCEDALKKVNELKNMLLKHGAYWDESSNGYCEFAREHPGWDTDTKLTEEMKEHDPGFQYDYTGVSYRVYSTELIDMRPIVKHMAVDLNTLDIRG